MSGGRNPFDPPEDGDRTVIGRAPAPRATPEDGDGTLIGAPTSGPFARPATTPFSGAAASAPPKRMPDSPFNPAPPSLESFTGTSNNPLLAAGTPLIILANSLRAVVAHDDVTRLRRTVVEELRRFQMRTRELSVSDEEARYGHYALCALIDEVVLSTPWGANSGWGAQTLVATFHNEVVSGDRMFEVADALEARPGRSPNLLELIYVCLSFGFEGRMRLERGGASRLVQLRDRLYAAIRNLRGPVERALSPAWRGVDAAYRPIAREIPAWVFAAGIGVLLLALYAAFVLRLAALGDNALKPLSGVYRPGAAELNRTAPAPAGDSKLYLTILDILKPDIDAGRVAVSDDPDAVGVRLKDRGLFASGSADLDSAYAGTMGRVAQAIGITEGPVPVTGHTDDQRIASLRYPSNQALSEARANAVVAALRSAGVPADRLQPSGVGETQPVSDNAEETGRRQNRRVEVAIPKTYAEGPAR
ncbi:type VI secretion system protein TssL, long form [Sphingomonas jatrophae]|uniref:Type VI secretion system protein ImpK n=1 Tax=Sphingomonas jatrophae TaxID=1166337 RepID=A0A1I6M242_9SPHN|nr:type VI secretion system protein TssL, long form [Sphingomonas jatrophae]SFS09779.1 type VI secretion system protein ImpK [Sphingomonas jatrophae]